MNRSMINQEARIAVPSMKGAKAKEAEVGLLLMEETALSTQLKKENGGEEDNQREKGTFLFPRGMIKASTSYL